MFRKWQWGALIAFVLAAAYIFVLGESGLLERIALYKKKEFLIERIDSIKEYNQKFEAEFRSNRGMSSADFLDAGFIPQGGRLVVIQGLEEEIKTSPLDEKIEFAGFRMSYLRGIYCVLSLLVLLFYFNYWRRSYDYD
ncbi:MAG: hypothetical protein FWG92_06455 [Leptospirales bacterium]|nr:hypothetical protein [Leptospirales bacterium]